MRCRAATGQPVVTPPDLDALPIVVIGLATATARRERLQRQLAAHGLDRRVSWFDAVDGANLGAADLERWLSAKGLEGYRRHPRRAYRGSMTRGALGCALSWRLVLERVREPVLVLEDDAVLCRNFPARFRRATAALPDDWDLVYAGFNPHSRPVGTAIDRFVTRIEAPIHGTCALLVGPRAAREICRLFPLGRQIDHAIIDELILPGRIVAYRLAIDDYALVSGDNLGGSSVQFDDTVHPEP